MQRNNVKSSRNNAGDHIIYGPLPRHFNDLLSSFNIRNSAELTLLTHSVEIDFTVPTIGMGIKGVIAQKLGDAAGKTSEYLFPNQGVERAAKYAQALTPFILDVICARYFPDRAMPDNTRQLIEQNIKVDGNRVIVETSDGINTEIIEQAIKCIDGNFENIEAALQQNNRDRHSR